MGIKLRVIEPCEEGWANMEPRSGGRFCDRCERTVIDFTRLSVRQAEARVRSVGPRICGHALVHSGTGEVVLRASTAAPRWLGGLALGAAIGTGCAAPPEPLGEPPIHASAEPDPTQALAPALLPAAPIPAAPMAAAAMAAERPASLTRAVAVDPSLVDRDAAPSASERARTAAKRARLHPPAAAPPPPHGYDIYDGMVDFVP